MRIFVLFTLFISAVIFFGCGFTDDPPSTVSDMVGDIMESDPLVPPEDMVQIPAGEFQMGSNDPEAFDDEKPEPPVYVDNFYIDTREVTNAEYQKFVLMNSEWQKGGTTARRLADDNYLKHWNGNDYPDGKDNHPVTYVSWHAANAYAAWARKRLPTEREWEKAARGGLRGQKYPWGNSIDTSNANYGLNIGDTVPVNRYSANAYGLYNMVGNVWEWCADEYSADSQVVRGGSWIDTARFVRVSVRGGSPPLFTSAYYGFRCAWPADH